MTEPPETEQSQKRCWWRLSEWGFSRREQRAIALLVVFILAGAIARYFHHSNMGQQLHVWSGASSSSTPLMEQPKLLKIDINKAGADELAFLPGIGPVRAKAIVSYRAEHGNFASSEDLLKISGIGEKTVAKISPYLNFSPESLEQESDH